MFWSGVYAKVFLLSWLASLALAKEGTCPLQSVFGRFKADCDFRGSFANPQVLRKYRALHNLHECAQFCYNWDKCLTMNFDATTGDCVLYKAFKEDMGYQTSPQDNGSYFEKLCFSTSCNVIEACNSYQACDYNIALGDYYYGYAEFGCSNGVDMQFDKKDKVHITKQVFIPKAKNTCQAVRSCQAHAPYGSFVVAYFLPKKQWLCTLYDNACRIDYDCRHNHKSYYASLENEYISRTTFMHKNKSIGATVAYWQYEQYY